MDNNLTVAQKKLVALIEPDYALLKFGYYGQEYAFAVAERDPRLYRKMLKRPDYHQFIADKDKLYRHETSIMMATLANMRGITAALKHNDEKRWYKTMFSIKAEAEAFTQNSIISDAETDF